MDSTYHKFREIMKIVESQPNDTQLGVHIREYYNRVWKPIKKHYIDTDIPIDMDEFKDSI